MDYSYCSIPLSIISNTTASHHTISYIFFYSTTLTCIVWHTKFSLLLTSHFPVKECEQVWQSMILFSNDGISPIEKIGWNWKWIYWKQNKERNKHRQLLVLADRGNPWVEQYMVCATLSRGPGYYLQSSNYDFTNPVQPDKKSRSRVDAKTNYRVATIICNPLINFLYIHQNSQISLNWLTDANFNVKNLNE